MSRRKKKNKKGFKKSRNRYEIPYEDMVRDVARYQAAVRDIPAIVAQETKKAWKQLPNPGAQNAPKAWFHDPLALQYSLGYKDRKFSLTYDMLRRVASQLGIISAIINTRSTQVAAFAQPQRMTKSLGFTIRHKNPDHVTTPAEQDFIRELEEFVLNCGRSERNPLSNQDRDDFEAWLRKTVRDSLTFDQACSEIVYDGLGVPYEFYAVDASTIRIAADDRYVGVNTSWTDRGGFVPGTPARFANLFAGQKYGYTNKAVDYVQVLNGQIEATWSKDELMFGVRNPRTDVYIQGYGYGEIEQALTIITSHLFAEQYNSNFFTQGSMPKGMLNLKTDNYTPEQLEGLQRQWLAQMGGVENAWKTPIFQAEGGVEWIEMNKSNTEMEFSKWIEYLIKIICGVFLVDPAELNFDMHGGQSQMPMFESSQEWKLKASRDRGLKPLLRFIAKMINKNIIDKIDDHFTFEFVGLDQLSEQEQHQMLVEQASTYLTLNETRQRVDLPPLPGGDVPMNPVYLNALETQGLVAPVNQGSEGPPPGPGSGGGDQGAPPTGPKYSQNFGFDQEGTQQ